MYIKEPLRIKYNKKTQTLELVDKDQDGRYTKCQNWRTIGPYMATYLATHNLAKFKNWTCKEKFNLELLQSITVEYNWEEFPCSIILNKPMEFEEMKEITELVGYVPDYFLIRDKKPLTLLHQTDYIEYLIENGHYRGDTDIDGDLGYRHSYHSFGMGLYCLDKDNFRDIEKIGNSWINLDNVYQGFYKGEYLRCIEDVSNGEKGGGKLKYQQEILIPFNSQEIEWRVCKKEGTKINNKENLIWK